MQSKWHRLNESSKSPKGRATLGAVTALLGLGLFLLPTSRDGVAGLGLGLIFIGFTQLAYVAYLARKQSRSGQPDDIQNDRIAS